MSLKFFSISALFVIFTAISNIAFSKTDEMPNSSIEQKIENIEQLIHTQMDKHRIAGATIAIMHDNQFLLRSGFGYADIKKKKKVDSEETLFRWGSISKTFTWVSILQLAEQGKIDLDADVNNYLTEITIPDTFDRPIKIKDLMSHMTGFEDLILGHIFEKDVKQVLTLKEYLKTFQPKRVRPAGELFTYSNYGSALAGHIVANVSGMSFEQYVETYIFTPLGMKHSTFREPLGETNFLQMPHELELRVSKAFSPSQSSFDQIEHFTFISGVSPAGGISAPVTDMAKFAEEILSGCGTILRRETCGHIQKPSVFFTSANQISMQFGFMQHREYSGHLRLGHNGGTDYFHSEMGLYPELNFAILISTNTTTGKQFNKELEQAIVKLLFGEIAKKPLQAGDDITLPADLSFFVGNYIDTRRPQSNVEVLYTFTQPTTYIENDNNKALIIKNQNESYRAKPISSHLFVDEENKRYFEFVEDSSGKITQMKSLGSFDKVPSFKTPENRIAILLVTIALLAFCFITLLISSIKRFVSNESATKKRYRRMVTLCIGLWLVNICLFVFSIIHDLGEFAYPYDFPSPWFKAASSLSVIMSMFSLYILATWIKTLRQKDISRFYKLVAAVPVTVITMLVIQMNNLHMLKLYIF